MSESKYIMGTTYSHKFEANMIGPPIFVQIDVSAKTSFQPYLYSPAFGDHEPLRLIDIRVKRRGKVAIREDRYIKEELLSMRTLETIAQNYARQVHNAERDAETTAS